MKTESGGRFELRLNQADARKVQYEATLATAEGEWNGRAEVDLESGLVEHRLLSEAPGWLLEAARAALRTAWRSHRDANSPWPRRLTRWRAEPTAKT